jgi:ATP-binding cassette, subfamily C (CFTR/MRP), member 1
MLDLVTVSGELTPVIVILAAIYWTRSGGLTIAEAFTSMSIITLSIQPLTMLLASIIQLAGVFGGFSRIQTFLLLEEQNDARQTDDNKLTRNFTGKTGDDSSEVGLAKRAGSVVERTSQDIELNTLGTDEPLRELDMTKPAVALDGVTVTVEDDINLLTDISMAIPQGSLTMIVGRVGCGKSSLLKAIIGELEPQKGSVSAIASTMAYCDQTPWLQNVSVRDNIVVQTHVDEEWLQTVIRACALEEDISGFPLGDATLVGSGGVALSGGQKQRLVSREYILQWFSYEVRLTTVP